MFFRMNTVTRLVACAAILLIAVISNVFAEPEQSKRNVDATTDAKAGLKTWAVISSAKIQKAGLADLLTAALAREKGIKLVERDRLRLVAKELTLSKMLGSSGLARRAGAGRILKADALILLTDETKDGKNFVRLVISDCRCGARLRVDYLPFVPEKIEPLAGKLLGLINETRSRFPSGIKHVFGVPHFVSRNLVHDYDHLQAGFANLLGNALASMPGVAVIETEEAHRIRREINLTDGADVKRIVPLFIIEGEFKVLRPAKAKGPTVTFSLKITDGARTVKTISPKTMKLSKAGVFLREDVPRQILQIRKNHVTSLSVDKQFAALVSRADTFARLGFWKDSTGLREAALLLKPDVVEQRILTIKETYRIVTANWPRGTISGAGHEVFERLCRSRLTRRRRALDHVEYLIRNRQVSRSVAIKLVRQTMDSIYTVRANYSSRLTEEERRKKEYLKNVYPLILDLAAESKKDSGRVYWQSILITLTLRRCDGNFLLKEDLDFLYKILTEVIPNDFPPSPGVTYLLCDVPYRPRYGDGHKRYRFSSKEYLRFLSRLKQSGKPLAIVYSRYGQLCYEVVNIKDKEDKVVLRKLWARCKSLMSEPLLGRNRYVAQGLHNMRDVIQRHLNPPKPSSPKTTQPQPKCSTGRLVFEEVPLRLKRLSGEVEPFKGVRWRSMGGIQRLVKCGDGLDVMWQTGAILFMRKKGLVEEIFVDKQPYFCDVRWDGRNVWIGTGCDGIWIVSPEGKLLAKIGKKQGLPPSDQGLLLHPIAPGKVCAIGSFGLHDRAWCAIVEFDGKDGKVNIFHRATRVPMPGEDDKKLGRDTALVFRPSWIHEFDTGKKDGNRILLVGRCTPCSEGRYWPLRIDLKTLRVSLFERGDLSFASNMSSQSYFSRDGKFVEGGRMFFHDGWVYAVGSTSWSRFNPKTWESERLNPGRLPYKYSILEAHGYHAVSAHYGLVAWDCKGTFYSISVKNLSATTRPTSNKAGEKEWVGGCPYRVIVVKQPPSKSSK